MTTTTPTLRIYISGAITRDPDYRAHFARAEEKLRRQRLHVFNPAKNEPDPDKSWQDYMKYDIRQLLDCSAIYLLKGWRKSKGAKLEYKIAKALDMVIMHER
ncbi:MAG: DUF4406 domain-containing protein [Acidaminococcaceae bacterium]|nr:DUF4406 domain-containing protein [Acidaminococcaceae bacterium]